MYKRQRLNRFIANYVKEGQCGFIKAGQMDNLTRQVLNIIYEVEKEKTKSTVLSLDIFKAFDCVEWPTLKLLIKHCGFGRRFIGVIDQLYSDNTSEVMFNDGLTERIFLGRGTRQGCPLSPILFCMAVELLANAIGKD